MTNDQILSDAKAAFALCEAVESENHIAVYLWERNKQAAADAQ